MPLLLQGQHRVEPRQHEVASQTLQQHLVDWCTGISSGASRKKTDFFSSRQQLLKKRLGCSGASLPLFSPKSYWTPSRCSSWRGREFGYCQKSSFFAVWTGILRVWIGTFSCPDAVFPDFLVFPFSRISRFSRKSEKSEKSEKKWEKCVFRKSEKSEKKWKKSCLENVDNFRKKVLEGRPRKNAFFKPKFRLLLALFQVLFDFL